MRAPILVLALAFASPPLAAQAAPETEIASDLAAVAKDGSWKVRKRDLYEYLVKFKSGDPQVKLVLEDYMRQRLVQARARKRNITVSAQDVQEWMDDLDKKIRDQSGGAFTLEKLMQEKEMSRGELEQRSRLAILRERVARELYNEKDPTRAKDKKVPEEGVGLAMDTIFREAKKEYDPEKLPAGVVARIDGVDITVTQYGRQLAFGLPATEVVRALNELIVAEEAVKLLGDGDASDEDLAVQKRWYIEHEKNRLKRQGHNQVDMALLKQWLAQRGLTFALVWSNPAFRAQARVRGHFRRGLDEKELRAYYEQNKQRYGDQLRVARILVEARAQKIPNAGKKILNLNQGKALANALWVRATQGEEFGKLAKNNSGDPDVITKNGGVVPLWLRAGTPGYEDTYAHALGLEKDGISKPWFSRGRGYVIVKLLERKKALGFEAIRQKIRADASEQAYRTWQIQAVRSATRNPRLLDE